LGYPLYKGHTNQTAIPNATMALTIIQSLIARHPNLPEVALTASDFPLGMLSHFQPSGLRQGDYPGSLPVDSGRR
jgi:hypothetical protein